MILFDKLDDDCKQVATYIKNRQTYAKENRSTFFKSRAFPEKMKEIVGIRSNIDWGYKGK